MDNDLVYLDQRASEERIAARKCVHAGAREIHLELAQAYEFRLFVLKQVLEIESAPLQFDIAEGQSRIERANRQSAVARRYGDGLIEQVGTVPTSPRNPDGR